MSKSPGTPRKKDPSLLRRLLERLGKTRRVLFDRLREVLTGRTRVDDELLEDMESVLLQADVGVATTAKILKQLKDRAETTKITKSDDILRLIREIVLGIMGGDEEFELSFDDESPRPFVVLVVGVNGTGKTTTIGKLAREFSEQGRSVLLVAGDTFRAAAAEQLDIWAQRTGAGIVRHAEGADPAAVVFDGLTYAKNNDIDIVLVDTAGRLHTKKNLMEELRKVLRVVKKVMPDAPHETVLVLDATTGQNAIQQTKVFHEALTLSALVMTKLDGTAKGGILVAISDLFKLPIVKIGIGEGENDLRDFAPRAFVQSLFGGPEEEEEERGGVSVADDPHAGGDEDDDDEDEDFEDDEDEEEDDDDDFEDDEDDDDFEDDEDDDFEDEDDEDDEDEDDEEE